MKECCKNPANLVRKQERPDLVVDTCKVCGCRHFRLSAEPGLLGLVGKPIGKAS